jgi:hypothetical protein
MHTTVTKIHPFGNKKKTDEINLYTLHPFANKKTDEMSLYTLHQFANKKTDEISLYTQATGWRRGARSRRGDAHRSWQGPSR